MSTQNCPQAAAPSQPSECQTCTLLVGVHVCMCVLLTHIHGNPSSVLSPFSEVSGQESAPSSRLGLPAAYPSSPPAPLGSIAHSTLPTQDPLFTPLSSLSSSRPYPPISGKGHFLSLAPPLVSFLLTPDNLIPQIGAPFDMPRTYPSPTPALRVTITPTLPGPLHSLLLPVPHRRPLCASSKGKSVCFTPSPAQNA